MKWTEVWPIVSGWYWYWGDPFGSKEIRPQSVRAYAVRVSQGANSVIRVCEGHFMYKGEAHSGLWMPMIVPEAPKEFLNE